jgi:hypothetical protein
MDHELPRIHEPEYDDPKEPYAFFGLAAYYVQCFEQSLILLIVALEVIHPTPIKKSSFDEVFARLDRKTMGQLLKHASQLTKIDTGLANRFSDLLDDRNYLMHHFFEENAAKWFSKSGRCSMLDELRNLAKKFQDGDRILTGIYEPLWHKLGVTKEIADREYEKLKSGIL